MFHLPAAYFEVGSAEEEPQPIYFKGHRIELLHVIELYQRGMSEAQIAQYFGGLDQDAIHTAVEYYIAHPAEVEQYMAEVNATAEKRRLSAPVHPAQARLEQLLRRKRSA